MTSRFRRALALVRSPAATYLLASLLGRIGTIVLIPLYTRRLSPAEYGSYGLALTLLGLLPQCISLGLNSSLTKEFYEAASVTAAAPRVGSIAKGLLGIAMVSTGVLAVIAVTFLRDGLGTLHLRQLLLTLLAALGTCASGVPDAFLRCAQRVRPVVVLQLATLFTTAALGILLVGRLHRGVDGAIEALALTSTMFGCYGVGFTFLRLGGNDVIARTRRALPFSAAFIPHYIASWTQDMADRWLLSAYGGGGLLGPYYLAGQLLSPVSMVVTSWNAAETPKLGETYRESGLAGVRAQLGKHYRTYFLAALVPALAIVAASPLAAHIIGKSLRGAIGILPFLAVVLLFDALYYPSANLIFYSNRPRAIPLTTGLTAIIGLSLGYILLRRFGLAGLVAARIATTMLRALSIGAAARVVGGRTAPAPPS